jgi:hypothetical protein
MPLRAKNYVGGVCLVAAPTMKTIGIHGHSAVRPGRASCAWHCRSPAIAIMFPEPPRREQRRHHAHRCSHAVKAWHFHGIASYRRRRMDHSSSSRYRQRWVVRMPSPPPVARRTPPAYGGETLPRAGPLTDAGFSLGAAASVGAEHAQFVVLPRVPRRLAGRLATFTAWHTLFSTLSTIRGG